MPVIPPAYEGVVNAAFLIITAAVAWHGLRFRDADGNPETVHLLFGCIAALYFLLVLLQDVLGVVRFLPA